MQQDVRDLLSVRDYKSHKRQNVPSGRVCDLLRVRFFDMHVTHSIAMQDA
jgi:hypothetical protein